MSEEQQADTEAAAAEAADGSLLEQILSEADFAPSVEGYETAKQGVQAFLAEMLAPNRKGEKVDKSLVDMMIAEIDQRLSARINEILHHEDTEARVCVAEPQVHGRQLRLPREHQARGS